MSITVQLEEFEKQRDTYSVFAKLLAGYLDAKIYELHGKDATLPLIHSITRRVKTVESLRRKLEKKDIQTTGETEQKTHSVGLMDDLAGVRIIFYFMTSLGSGLEMPQILHFKT